MSCRCCCSQMRKETNSFRRFYWTFFIFFFRTFSEKAGVELLVATPGRYLGGNPIHLIVAGWDW